MNKQDILAAVAHELKLGPSYPFTPRAQEMIMAAVEVGKTQALFAESPRTGRLRWERVNDQSALLQCTRATEPPEWDDIAVKVTGNWVEQDRENAIAYVLAALNAYDSNAPVTVPSGWKLVPIVPTEEMMKWGEQNRTVIEDDSNPEGLRMNTLCCWDAMLEVAPESPQTKE